MGLYKLVVLCVCVEWLFSMGTMCLCGVAVLYGYYVSVWSGCSLWVLRWLCCVIVSCTCAVRLFPVIFSNRAASYDATVWLGCFVSRCCVYVLFGCRVVMWLVVSCGCVVWLCDVVVSCGCELWCGVAVWCGCVVC